MFLYVFQLFTVFLPPEIVCCEVRLHIGMSVLRLGLTFFSYKEQFLIPVWDHKIHQNSGGGKSYLLQCRINGIHCSFKAALWGYWERSCHEHLWLVYTWYQHYGYNSWTYLSIKMQRSERGNSMKVNFSLLVVSWKLYKNLHMKLGRLQFKTLLHSLSRWVRVLPQMPRPLYPNITSLILSLAPPGLYTDLQCTKDPVPPHSSLSHVVCPGLKSCLWTFLDWTAIVPYNLS